MFKYLERFANSHWPGYKPEPGEIELGRVTVQTDRGSGFAVVESSSLALTNRRVLLLEAHFHLALLIVPFVLMVVLHLHPIYLPLMVIAVALLVRMFRIRTAAVQRREDLLTCVSEPGAGGSAKPRLVLGFRDGTHWNLKNPNRASGRLDALVGLLNKGGFAVGGWESPATTELKPRKIMGNG